MSNRRLAVSLVILSAVATVCLADHSRPRRPTLTPQSSGTTQGLIAQGILLAIFVLGAAWVFWLSPMRARRTSEVSTA